MSLRASKPSDLSSTSRLRNNGAWRVIAAQELRLTQFLCQSLDEVSLEEYQRLCQGRVWRTDCYVSSITGWQLRKLLRYEVHKWH